ncbi:alpha/beta fold hydrolase [Thiohalocapsa sp. ML1]|jgi:pimeloyl-ACP methyl ester carboxylesterase|uniref:alpha/beta fold hydrolase n=1 Tax=Thiohalocapsa sp. ML1 TaxID=1431688 RepID=UPI0007320F6A|nr:alpha/beta fold hydrolase [Thiohalocapsa sp. ML1]
MLRLPADNEIFRTITAPLRLALEARAPWELGAGFAAQPLLTLAPKGDGHPVLVLPLMFGTDINTLPLRRFLAGRGYAASAWGQGLNLGPRAGVFEACRERLAALSDEGRQQVSLVGWSLGGLFARALALAAPAEVRQVICLGTPIAADPPPAALWRTYEQLTGDPMGLPPALGDLHGRLPVPATSIYSRSDGIVAWAQSREPDGPQAENIEVESSHLGLGVHPLTLYAVADRLAQPLGQWQPFRRDGLLGLLYPEPGRG